MYLSTWFGVDALIISIDVSRYIAEAASFGVIQCPSMSYLDCVGDMDDSCIETGSACLGYRGMTLRFGDAMSSSLSSGRYLCLAKALGWLDGWFPIKSAKKCKLLDENPVHPGNLT